MNNFEENVKHYIKVHEELHGLSTSIESIVKDLKNSFGYKEEDSIQKIKEIKNKEYGIIIGRFQPFTDGHNSIVQDIIRDGREPVIFMGSPYIDDKNPLNFEEKSKLVKMLYPDIKIVKIQDNDDWDEWFDNISSSMLSIAPKEKLYIYSHCKEIDKTNFEFCGKKYKDMHYTIMFKEHNFNIVKLNEVKCNLGEVVHASDVRKDEEKAKRNLDARIYRYLKDVKGWWECS